MAIALSQRPAVAGQLVAALCARQEGNPENETLNESLCSGLTIARMAQENRQKRAGAFIKSATDAVVRAAVQGRLTVFHRIILGSAWVRAGLQAPAALEMSERDISVTDMKEMNEFPQDPDSPATMLSGAFRNVIEKSGGGAFELYTMTSEIFPAMWAEMRAIIIAWSVDRPESVHARLACSWLLDPAPRTRLAAARALADRASASGLHPDAAIRMVTLRSWMPDDDARAAVDRALKDAMRSGLATGKHGKPWKIHSVMASLPDGAGTQIISIALQLGDSRKIAMLLLKHGFGVRGAYFVPCISATEQRALVQGITEHTGAVRVPLTWLERTLSMALADGLAAGIPPAHGLIQVAELCGLTTLRPEAETTEALIATQPAAERIGGLSAQERDRLMNVDDEWRNRIEIASSWFEEIDHVDELAKGEPSEQVFERNLWSWLETRRGHWARIVALAADVLRAAGHQDTDDLVATATALIKGRELKEIPVMAEVHRQTIEIRAGDVLQVSEDVGE